MVVIHLKITEKNHFLYEANSLTKVEDLIKDLVLSKFHFI